MKTLSKKLFSLLLVLIMLVSIVPFAAFATEPDPEHKAKVDESAAQVTDWEKDVDGHWIPCAVETCKEHKYFAGAHNFGEMEHDDTKHWQTCKTCGMKVEEDHEWGEWSVVTDSDESHTGTKKHVCKKPGCGAEATDTIPVKTPQETKRKIHVRVIHGDDIIFETDVPVTNPTAQIVIDKDWLTNQAKFTSSKAYSIDNNVNGVVYADTLQPVQDRILKDITCDQKIDVKIHYPTTSYKVTLDANGGMIDGKYPTTYFMVGWDEHLIDLPTASHMSKEGYTFIGWYDNNGGKHVPVSSSSRYNWGDDGVTLTAEWSQKTKLVTIKRVLGDNVYGAETVFDKVPVPEGVNLLNWLHDNYDSVIAYNRIPSGYTWYGSSTNSEYGYWYDHTGADILSAQRTITSDTTVHFKCVPITYKLTFDPLGGTITGGKEYIEVKYGDAVGTLPVATKEGYVFQGWLDDDDVKWTSSTVLKSHCNVALHAKWAEQAKVYLRVYLNGSTSNPVILAMDDHISGQNVTQKDAEKLILQYYSAQDGKKLELVGLFTKSTWNDYVAGKISKGDATYTIPNLNDETTLYVMVNNAKQGPTTTTTPRTTKPSGIPKTGDTAMIYTAATVMVLAAAALVTTRIIRKKKNV